jgi:hypothetical protein
MGGRLRRDFSRELPGALTGQGILSSRGEFAADNDLSD